MKTWDDDADSGPAAPRRPAAPSVIEGLPAFYRETPELVGPLVGVADDLLVTFRRGLSRGIERAAGAIAPSPAERESAGTCEAVAEWLEERCGERPRVWCGFRAVPRGPGSLELRRSRGPSAVLAWEKERLQAARGISVPEALLPLAARVQAVLLARMPQGRSPRAGERVAGVVVWEREPCASPGSR
ncbi:MAG: hypothetical protein HY721_02055 [Planctomycetes bacterium]|nr:hypothetical protein [Planctomycetota bacterium]